MGTWELKRILTFKLAIGAMSARSSPADLAVEMLGGTDEELAVSAVTFRRVAIISYKRFYE